MIFTFIFLLKAFSCHNSDPKVIPNDQDSTWMLIQSEYYILKCVSFNFQRLSNFHYQPDIATFIENTQNFFSKNPTLAFAALENHAYNFRFILFFLKIVSYPSAALLDFDDKKILSASYSGELVISQAISFIESVKTPELFWIVIRIFKKFPKRFPEVYKVLKYWESEVHRLRVAETNEEIIQEFPPHPEFFECYRKIIILLKSESSSHVLLDYLVDRYDTLASDVKIDLFSLPHILEQPISFIMILCNRLNRFHERLGTINNFQAFYGDSKSQKKS
jgi:hypothetical protein